MRFSWIRNRSLLCLVFLTIVLGVLLLRGIGDSSLGYPDADRILMDGVFIRDAIIDFPLFSPLDYAYNYFAQYPALSIGYRPPLFPAVEGIFNLIFGVSIWSSRLALFLFAVSGLVAWFKLAEAIFDRHVAFFSSLLWISTPFLAQWGWYTMAEIPVLSMVLVTAYFFYRFLETSAGKYLYLTAIFLGLAAWTKQTAVFAGLWFVLVLLVQGKLVAVLRRRDTWLAMLVLALLLAPLAVMTLSFGDMNVYQSIGEIPAGRAPRLSIENWSILLRTLVDKHLTWPVLLLALAGAGAGLVRRDKRMLFGAAGIFAVYVFFSMLVGKNPRYPIFWIPLFALFAAMPLNYMAKQRKFRLLFSALLLGVAVYQTVLVYRHEPRFATGYKQAAAVALEYRKGPTIFVDAYNNGYFTYFVRQQDPDRDTYVLRGDKLITSASISQKFWLKIHASTFADFRKILDRYAVSVIVVESKDYTGLAPHIAFRKFLKTDSFRLIDKIPIRSNRNISILPGSPPLNGRSLLIYEYLDAKTDFDSEIILDLPIIGKTIRVKPRKKGAD